MPTPLRLIRDRELALIGKLMDVREDFVSVIQMVVGGIVVLREFVTGSLSLAEAAQAFAAPPQLKQIKVLDTVSGRPATT